MMYKIIFFFVVSAIPAIKRPIYGGFTGMIAAPGIYYAFNPFDVPTIFVLSLFGFAIGLLWGVFAWNLFHGDEYNQQYKKTYVMPMSKAGTGQRGGIIYTDDEEKNARENKRYKWK